MNKNNQIKTEQLGMPIGTATSILKKAILFDLLKRHKENVCFQCQKEIESVDDLSIEHKIPWLHSQNPIELFFSLDNISFSHLSCNVGAKRMKRGLSHGTHAKYANGGCRCEQCTEAHRIMNSNNRKRKKNASLAQRSEQSAYIR